MQGVTAAIVAFIFLCLVIPSLIKNKSQYYAAFIAVLAVIFLDAVAHVFPESAVSIKAVCYVLAGFVQIIAVVMLFLAAGGMTLRELGGDMIEVLRRGEEEKEVIIPLSDEAKQKIRAAQEESERRVKRDEQSPKVYVIDDPTRPAPANPPPPPKPPATGPLPLE
jgi:hypothetical protein